MPKIVIDHDDTVNHKTSSTSDTRGEFPMPIVCDRLERRLGSNQWLLHGCVAAGEVTLLSALWKAGKTTLIAHMLKAFGNRDGVAFCGLAIRPAKILYVTEEGQHRWAERREELGLGNNLSFITRPFITKPDFPTWGRFIAYLESIQQDDPSAVIVLDTLSNLWPVRDENSAAEVSEALMPLHILTGKAALLLVHHLRKADGREATGSRGSGAITAFADTLLELRRRCPTDRNNRQRVLTGYGRYDASEMELVIEMPVDGLYQAVTTGKETSAKLLQTAVAKIVNSHPGCSYEDVMAKWPSQPAPSPKRLIAELRRGLSNGEWTRRGRGIKGSPYRYFPASQG